MQFHQLLHPELNYQNQSETQTQICSDLWTCSSTPGGPGMPVVMWLVFFFKIQSESLICNNSCKPEHQQNRAQCGILSDQEPEPVPALHLLDHRYVRWFSWFFCSLFLIVAPFLSIKSSWYGSVWFFWVLFSKLLSGSLVGSQSPEVQLQSCTSTGASRFVGLQTKPCMMTYWKPVDVPCVLDVPHGVEVFLLR